MFGPMQQRDTDMPLINFKAIEGVITSEQKRELIEKLTDATASVYGENIRQVTWVVIEDVSSGEWGIAGTTSRHSCAKAKRRPQRPDRRPDPDVRASNVVS